MLILSLPPDNLSGPHTFITVRTKLAIIAFGHYIMTFILHLREIPEGGSNVYMSVDKVVMTQPNFKP